jgi:hypothetical protein
MGQQPPRKLIAIQRRPRFLVAGRENRADLLDADINVSGLGDRSLLVISDERFGVESDNTSLAAGGARMETPQLAEVNYGAPRESQFWRL